MTIQNPLYQPSSVPDFSAIRPEHADAVLQIIEENREQIDCLANQPHPTWDSLMQPLERMENRLALAFSPISHLPSVISTEAWRSAYEKVLPALSAYNTDISQHKALYEAITRLRNSDTFATLNPTQQKIVNDQIENFERSGVGLPDAEKATFKKYSLRLSECTTQFSNNLLDATNAWHLQLEDDSQLKGVPASTKAVMADLAKQQEQSGYRITLDAPIVMAILTYADDRALRETVYKAHNMRALNCVITPQKYWDLLTMPLPTPPTTKWQKHQPSS